MELFDGSLGNNELCSHQSSFKGGKCVRNKMAMKVGVNGF